MTSPKKSLLIIALVIFVIASQLKLVKEFYLNANSIVYQENYNTSASSVTNSTNSTSTHGIYNMSGTTTGRNGNQLGNAHQTLNKTGSIEPVATTIVSHNKNLSDFDRELDHLVRNSTFRSPHRSMFGFFYQCYKRPKATLEVVSSFSRRMPQSPIYLVSSGGYRYDPLEQRFPNVHFVHDTVNVDLHKGGKLDRWFDWIKAAALWCNCEYLVLLEDDTFLRKPLVDRPLHDAGGLKTSPMDFTWPAILTEQFGFNYSHYSYGMCGGSYVRTEAFLEAHSRLNWTRIFDMRAAADERFGMISDMTLALVMMDAGYTLKPWDDLQQKYWRGSNDAFILHNEKAYYNAKLSRFDGRVISDELSQNESACVYN